MNLEDPNEDSLLVKHKILLLGSTNNNWLSKKIIHEKTQKGGQNRHHLWP